MNTLFFYADGSTRVVHRIIPSEFLYSVAHDFRASLIPIAKVEVAPLKPEEIAKAKMKLLTAKADYKQHKGSKDHTEQRNEFISAFLASKLPNWGSIKFSV